MRKSLALDLFMRCILVAEEKGSPRPPERLSARPAERSSARPPERFVSEAPEAINGHLARTVFRSRIARRTSERWAQTGRPGPRPTGGPGSASRPRQGAARTPWDWRDPWYTRGAWLHLSRVRSAAGTRGTRPSQSRDCLRGSGRVLLWGGDGAVVSTCMLAGGC